jgi:DNA-binding transcriptional regulator YiaG
MTGKNFRKIRLALKVSQRSLALILGVTDKTISAWEKLPMVTRPVALAISLLQIAETDDAAKQAVLSVIAPVSSAKSRPRA